MKKRTIALIMALVMILGTLAGCSGKNPEATPTTEAAGNNEVAQNTPTEGAKGVTFTLGRTANANDTATLELEASRQEQLLASTGNTIEYVDFTYDYTAIGAMFEGGQIPDTFQVANSEPQKLIANGWGRDITECVKAAGIDLNDFNQGLLGIYTAPNGEIWGLPKYSYTMGIMANAALFREAGLVNEDGSVMIPKTWDELIEFGEIINEKTGKGGIAVTAVDGYGGWYYTAMALSFGADLCQMNSDGTYTSRLTSPEAVEAMEFFQKLFKSKAIYGDPTIDGEGDCSAQFAAGNVAMIFGSQDGPSNHTNAANDANFNPEDLILIPMPMSTDPEKYIMYTGGDGIWFGPTATDEEVIAALEYYVTFGLLGGWNEEIEASYRAQLDVDVKQNHRVMLPSYPVYVDESYEKKVEILKSEYMDHFDFDAQFGYFYERVEEATASYEEDGDMQNMFRIVVAVMQELFVNDEANLEELMAEANDQYQSLLDSMN